MWGKSEHLTLKKNPTSSLKIYLFGLETGRIFGNMISAKKTAKIRRKIILKLL
jgi:hypothetical protein